MYLLNYFNYTSHRAEELNSLVNKRNSLISFSKQSIQTSTRFARRCSEGRQRTDVPVPVT